MLDSGSSSSCSELLCYLAKHNLIGQMPMKIIWEGLRNFFHLDVHLV